MLGAVQNLGTIEQQNSVKLSAQRTLLHIAGLAITLFFAFLGLFERSLKVERLS